MRNINIVNNTKTTFVVINNELVECKMLGYRISRNKETGEYKLVYEVESHLGVTFVPKDTTLYGAVESYKAGAPLVATSIVSPLSAANALFHHCFIDGIDGDEVRVWAYLNGDAVLADVYDMYEYIGFRYGSGGYLPEGSIKLDCYDSREDVFNYNPKEYVDMDGTKKVSPGSLSKLLLTDEQTAIVAELRETLHRLNESGAQILWDGERDLGYVVNNKDVVWHEWDCTPDGYVDFAPHSSHNLPELILCNMGGCRLSIKFKEDK